MTRRLLLTATLLLLLANPADAHLIRYPDKPLLSQLENRERSQERNLGHARFVCNQGGGKHRRWACKAVGWISRELEQTRAVLRPAIPAMWYEIAVCESGRRPPNWQVHSRATDRYGVPLYYGGLQFLTSTWLAYGGGRYASRADLAAPWQQVAIASGMSLAHWPHCGAPYR